MIKKITIVMVVLAFSCGTLLMMTSCAKKQVRVEEEMKPAEKPTVAEEKPAVVEKKPAVVEEGAGERAEAERQARLAEVEKARKLRAEVQDFEADKIFFDFDKSELKPEARAMLEKKAAWLRDHRGYNVRIEGHCDERGTNEYNLALGERRAMAAFKYLNALGISADRMSTISYGEERPFDPNHNSWAWSLNRRDEFKLTK